MTAPQSVDAVGNVAADPRPGTPARENVSSLRLLDPLLQHGSFSSELGGQELDQEHLPLQPMLICAWCVPNHVMREGSLPASHGLCELAAAGMDAELSRREALQTGRLIGDAIAAACYGGRR